MRPALGEKNNFWNRAAGQFRISGFFHRGFIIVSSAVFMIGRE